MTSAQIKNAGFGGALSFYPEDNQTPTPAVSDTPSQDLQAKATKSAFFKVLGKLNIFPHMACSSNQTIGLIVSPAESQASKEEKERLELKRQAETADEPIAPEDKIKIASQPVPMSAEQRYELFLIDRNLRPARGFLDYKAFKEFYPEVLPKTRAVFLQYGFAPYCGVLEPDPPHLEDDLREESSNPNVKRIVRAFDERYLKSNRPFWPDEYEQFDWKLRPIRYNKCLERSFVEYFGGFDRHLYQDKIPYPVLNKNAYRENNNHKTFYTVLPLKNFLDRVTSEGRKVEIMETLVKHKKDDGIYSVKDGYLESSLLETLPGHGDTELSQPNYTWWNITENGESINRHYVEIDIDANNPSIIILPEFVMTDDLQLMVSYEKIRARKDYPELLKSNDYKEVIIPHPQDSYRSQWAYFKGEQRINPATIFLALQRDAFVRDLVANKAIDVKSHKRLSDAFKEMQLTPLRWKRIEGAPTVLKCYDEKIHQIIHIPFLKPVATFEEFLKAIGSIKMSTPPTESKPDPKSKSAPSSQQVPSTGGA